MVKLVVPKTKDPEDVDGEEVVPVFENPFAKLVDISMQDQKKRKKGHHVAIYNVQKMIAVGLREYLNPTFHEKGKKTNHADLDSSGLVQKIAFAWNSAQASTQDSKPIRTTRVAMPTRKKANS